MSFERAKDQIAYRVDRKISIITKFHSKFFNCTNRNEAQTFMNDLMIKKRPFVYGGKATHWGTSKYYLKCYILILLHKKKT